eukprot:TRINITY_DN18992_c0_g2_i1.p1 TRINITY_DN18992_c0_g2~~TRINITY_DN18992_c0_g2_i1.p1  ORF type:complete len:113 (+),score=3.97 TRINITY_DN18992_c0_g2_i1:140-478(+)
MFQATSLSDPCKPAERLTCCPIEAYTVIGWKDQQFVVDSEFPTEIDVVELDFPYSSCAQKAHWENCYSYLQKAYAGISYFIATRPYPSTVALFPISFQYFNKRFRISFFCIF